MDTLRFLDRLLEERTRFELLLNRVQPSRMTIRGAIGRWSVKDALAYILVCEEYLADRVSEIIREVSDHPVSTFKHSDQSLVDENSLDSFVRKYRNIPLEDIVARENQAYLSMVNSLEMLPPDLPEELERVESMSQIALSIFQYHVGKIQIWLESTL